jgi:hypothetical protein
MLRQQLSYNLIHSNSSYLLTKLFLNYSPVSDSLYIPLVSILTMSPYISQRVHFPVLNFVTYNFMHVFFLQLFPHSTQHWHQCDVRNGHPKMEDADSGKNWYYCFCENNGLFISISCFNWRIIKYATYQFVLNHATCTCITWP